MKIVTKLIAGIFALMFIWAAVLQYNDPDPLLWYSLYGVAGIACLFYIFNRFPTTLGVLLGLVYLMGTFWVWPRRFEGVEIGHGDIENIERGREALGLLITAVVIFFLSWQSRRGKKKP